MVYVAATADSSGSVGSKGSVSVNLALAAGAGAKMLMAAASLPTSGRPPTTGLAVNVSVVAELGLLR